jgi:hypothetical protein
MPIARKYPGVTRLIAAAGGVRPGSAEPPSTRTGSQPYEGISVSGMYVAASARRTPGALRNRSRTRWWRRAPSR